MKLLVFTSPHGNNRALCHRIAAVLSIAAIVTVQPRRDWSTKKPGLAGRARNFGRRLVSASVGLPLRRAWFGMLAHFDRLYPDFPQAPSEVADINAPEVLALVEREQPDLVVVSGTNLLKQPLIERIHKSGRVVNLHTGISPYIKGGPNCTNWCLALGRFDLIGNTVMWLDAGIDSGAIIATERTPFEGTESILGLHVAVMEHAHALYVRCIRMFAEGRSLPAVRQDDIAEGRLFLTRHWSSGPIVRAVRNFYGRYRRQALDLQEPLILVSPEAGPQTVPSRSPA
jgi:methionyl-tRNA formyltransferase